MKLPVDAQILANLRGAGESVPAVELAVHAGLSVPELHRRVDELTAAGFEFEHHPERGYRLCVSPDRLIADDLRARLGPEHRLVREIIVLAETGSTNDVAGRLGAEGVESGVLVLAERQTSGRGRFGRRWASAAGRGLWMSLLLRPALPSEQWPRLTTWAAVAVAAAAGERATIKWPNDVQIEGKKIAGILIEVGGAERLYAVVGIGINANQTSEDFPPELSETAQSLRMAGGRPVDRAELLVSALRELERRWPLLDRDFGRLVAEASARSSLLGQWVRVRMGEDFVEGMAEELDPEGHLLLRRANGTVLSLTAGEVTLHVTP